MSEKDKWYWKPIKNGKTYCSPACGGGCTLAQYNKAKKRAESLVKKLGAGWSYHLNENLGWFFYLAYKDNKLRVREHNIAKTKGVKFTAIITTSPGVQFVGHGDTPQVAIKKAHMQLIDEHHALDVAVRQTSHYSTL